MNPFKQRLAQGEQLVGGWCMSGSPTVLEAMGHAGYDHVVIDMEHSPAAIHDLRGLLQACEATPALPVVRMPDQDPTKIKHALDLGALNLVFPYVQNAEQARAIANACYYAPKGERGYARMHRGSKYTTQADYVSTVNDHIHVIVQLETPESVSNMEAILSTPGVTGALFGPGDFAMCLGLGGDVTHPTVKDAMAKVGAYCKARNIPLGTVLPTPEYIQWAFQNGFSFVSHASEMGLMMGGMRNGIAAIKALRT
jgi:2-dehydro-3-deoxyglucarate aldolase